MPHNYYNSRLIILTAIRVNKQLNVCMCVTMVMPRVYNSLQIEDQITRLRC